MNKLVLPIQFTRYRKGKKSVVVPTWNHLYLIRRNKLILDKYAVSYKNKLISLAKDWMEENEWETTVNHKVFVDVWIYWSDARKRDCHNIDKVLMDALEDAGIYDNDCNALLRYQDFDIDSDNPRIEVKFTVGELYTRKKKGGKTK